MDSNHEQLAGTSSTKSPAELFALLDQLGITHTTINHPPMFTVAESKKFRKTSATGSYTKNLFLRNKRGLMWLVTCFEDSLLDLHSVATQLNAGRLSFGSRNRLIKYLGVTPGAVSPFSLINDSDRSVSFVLEEKLLRHSNIFLHPLNNTQTTCIATRDFLRFVRHTGHPPLYLSLDPPKELP